MRVYLFLILLLLTPISLAHQAVELKFNGRPIEEVGEMPIPANRTDVWEQYIGSEQNDLSLTIPTSSWLFSFESYFLGLLLLLSGFLIRRERMSRRHLQVELRDLKVEASKLKELAAIKSAFCQDLIDELHLPLTLFQESAPKLLKSFNPPQENPDYKKISQATDRLLELKDQVYALSHLGSDKPSLDLVRGDILGFLATLSKTYLSLFETKAIRYSYISDHQSLWAFFDHEKLEKIITYLISNAYRFTPSGKEVKLEVFTETISPGSVSLCIKVTDERAAIPEESQTDIVGLGLPTDTTKDDSFRGISLGLLLVKEWVASHGGDISFQTSPGVGTTSSVTIPLRASEQVDPRGSLSWKVSRSALSFLNTEDPLLDHRVKDENFLKNRQRPSVLVVAADKSVRKIIYSLLRPIYDVYEAADESRGWDLAQRIVPDLIINDVTGDQMHGMGLSGKAKSIPRTSDIAFILLASQPFRENKLEALCASADECLIKPLDLEELKLSIQNVLERKRKLLRRCDRSMILQPEAIIERTKDEKFLIHIHSILEKHVNNTDFCIDFFCREAGMSRVNLYRRLKALTNQSPGELVRDFRLKRAAMLLEQEYGNVSEVAYAVGFNSVSYFTRSFRSKYGQTPTDFLTSSNHRKQDKH